MRRGAGIAALALLLAACAPGSGIEIGSKDVPVDIVLGDQRPPVRALPPGAGPVTGFPGFIAPPVPRPDPGAPPPPAPPPQECPLASPFDAAKLVARKAAPAAPVPAAYLYRNAGTLKIGEGAATAYPPEQTRTVNNVRVVNAGTYEFDVAVLLAGTTTTTTYHVINAGDTPDRGIYIVGIVTLYPDGDTQAWSPDPDQPLLLMPFPPPEYGSNLEDELDRQRGAEYRSAGTDPLSQTTMALQAQIEGKERANACGEWVDAYSVRVISGKIVGPTQNVDFSGTYLIAPQYGALVVQDNLTFTGTQNDEPFESRNRATINRVPVEPR